MAGAVATSILGMGVHTVREFGVAGLLSPATGTLPVALIQGLLFLGWWRSPSSRLAMSQGLRISGFFQLIGGAILSVLPLSFLPFEPEQSVDHYMSHVLLGVTQIPLLITPSRIDRGQHRGGET